MPSGVTMTIHFHGEKVHQHSIYPSKSENIYESDATATIPHAYAGKEDGGPLPMPKQTGPHALLATAIKVRMERLPSLNVLIVQEGDLTSPRDMIVESKRKQ
jgi:hypothetical protein